MTEECSKAWFQYTEDVLFRDSIPHQRFLDFKAGFEAGAKHEFEIAKETVLKLIPNFDKMTQGIIDRATKKAIQGAHEIVQLTVQVELERFKPVLQKCLDIIDDDMEERPARYSLGKLYKEIEMVLKTADDIRDEIVQNIVQPPREVKGSKK